MKRNALFSPILWMGMLVWWVFVLLLTVLPGHAPLVRVLAGAIGGTEISSVAGHTALFIILTLLSWRALSQWFGVRQALMLAMLFALLLGTSTELLQWFVSDRSMTLSDLLGNWLGVFIAGFAISFSREQRGAL